MPKSWRRKAALVLFATLLGIYLLVPTVFQMDKTRETLEANGQDIPWYIKVFPKKALNLGLDLRGGIYIEMEVDLPNAIERKVDISITDVEASLKEQNIPFESITQPKGEGKMYISTQTSSDLERVRGVINSDFRNVLAVSDTTMEKDMPTLIAVLNDKYKSYFLGKAVDQALETIRNRIDRYGVSEPSITKTGTNRVAIELPGISDPERAINIIKKTGQLDFKLVDETIKTSELISMVSKVREENKVPEGYAMQITGQINDLLGDKLPEGSEIAFELERDPVTRRVLKGTPYLLKRKAEVTGDMLQNAQVSVHENEPYVDLTLDKRGTTLFGKLTAENVNKRLAIVLDGNVMKAPVIKEAIPSGRAQITLGYGNYQEVMKEAEDLVLVLQEGALPARLTEATKTVVGPSLGQESINSGLKAGAIAAFLVVIFMIFYYRMSGFYADIALGLNMLLILACLSLFGATLTLPGITGMVLTMGMAIDANILICERIREELRTGKQVKSAIDSGYANAMRAVIDTHITTLISGIVLYQFGTGPIKGFAITLSIGILTTLFTAIIVTRLIYDYRVIRHKVTSISI